MNKRYCRQVVMNGPCMKCVYMCIKCHGKCLLTQCEKGRCGTMYVMYVDDCDMTLQCSLYNVVGAVP